MYKSTFENLKYVYKDISIKKTQSCRFGVCCRKFSDFQNRKIFWFPTSLYGFLPKYKKTHFPTNFVLLSTSAFETFIWRVFFQVIINFHISYRNHIGFWYRRRKLLPLVLNVYTVHLGKIFWYISINLINRIN